MDLYVLLQIRARCEWFPTLLAHIWPITCVQPLMTDQITYLLTQIIVRYNIDNYLWEGLVAVLKFTWVGLSLVMNPLMLLEWGVLNKGCIALFAILQISETMKKIMILKLKMALKGVSLQGPNLLYGKNAEYQCIFMYG